MTITLDENRVFAPNDNKVCAKGGCRPDESTIRTSLSGDYMTIYAHCLTCGQEFVCGTMNMRGIERISLVKTGGSARKKERILCKDCDAYDPDDTPKANEDGVCSLRCPTVVATTHLFDGFTNMIAETTWPRVSKNAWCLEATKDGNTNDLRSVEAKQRDYYLRRLESIASMDTSVSEVQGNAHEVYEYATFTAVGIAVNAIEYGKGIK